MNLFSMFRKDKTPVPANRLEELMMLAALEPGRRPDFYRQLFHFDLYVGINSLILFEMFADKNINLVVNLDFSR